MALGAARIGRHDGPSTRRQPNSARSRRDNRRMDLNRTDRPPSSTQRACTYKRETMPAGNRFSILADLDSSATQMWAFDFTATGGRKGKRDKHTKTKLKQIVKQRRKEQSHGTAAVGTTSAVGTGEKLVLDSGTQSPGSTIHSHTQFCPPRSEFNFSSDSVRHHWLPEFRPIPHSFRINTLSRPPPFPERCLTRVHHCSTISSTPKTPLNFIPAPAPLSRAFSPVSPVRVIKPLRKQVSKLPTSPTQEAVTVARRVAATPQKLDKTLPVLPTGPITSANSQSPLVAQSSDLLTCFPCPPMSMSSSYVRSAISTDNPNPSTSSSEPSVYTPTPSPPPNSPAGWRSQFESQLGLNLTAPRATIRSAPTNHGQLKKSRFAGCAFMNPAPSPVQRNLTESAVAKKQKEFLEMGHDDNCWCSSKTILRQNNEMMRSFAEQEIHPLIRTLNSCMPEQIANYAAVEKEKNPLEDAKEFYSSCSSKFPSAISAAIDMWQEEESAEEASVEEASVEETSSIEEESAEEASTIEEDSESDHSDSEEDSENEDSEDEDSEDEDSSDDEDPANVVASVNDEDSENEDSEDEDDSSEVEEASAEEASVDEENPVNTVASVNDEDSENEYSENEDTPENKDSSYNHLTQSEMDRLDEDEHDNDYSFTIQTITTSTTTTSTTTIRTTTISNTASFSADEEVEVEDEDEDWTSVSAPVSRSDSPALEYAEYYGL